MKKTIFLVSALLVAMLAVSGCKADSKSSSKESAMTQNVTELIKKDTVQGEGREAEAVMSQSTTLAGCMIQASQMAKVKSLIVQLIVTNHLYSF